MMKLARLILPLVGRPATVLEFAGDDRKFELQLATPLEGIQCQDNK